MNPSRFQTFAEAYAPAVLQAVVDLGIHLGSQKPQEYALEATLAMLGSIQSHGIAAVEHYVLNTRGGAFRHTCEALGINCTPRALQDYIEGRN